MVRDAQMELLLHLTKAYRLQRTIRLDWPTLGTGFHTKKLTEEEEAWKWFIEPCTLQDAIVVSHLWEAFSLRL